MVEVIHFCKKQKREQDEFLTGEGLQMMLIHTYTPIGPVTTIHYGKDTFFSLWVGSSGGVDGFMKAYRAQGIVGPMYTEDLFKMVNEELDAEENPRCSYCGAKDWDYDDWRRTTCCQSL